MKATVEERMRVKAPGKWAVDAHTRHMKTVHTTLVTAPTKERARECGRIALRMLGFGKYHISVRQASAYDLGADRIA